MNKWSVRYGNNLIEVQEGFRRERLYVNGELQDEQEGWNLRSRLWGQLPTGENIKVSIGGGWISIQCRIFVDHKLIFTTK